jgi:predicted transcriptional regulator
MSSNSSQFLDAFAEIEKLLRRISGSERQVPFYHVVDAAAQRSPDVRRHRDDLKEYADLRNAITHERSGGQAIAEPHAAVVSHLRKLATSLANPPRVLPAFAKRVYSVDVLDSIHKVLAFFFPKNFSQVPVTRGDHVVGVLTTNTVSRWLAAQARSELVDLTEHTVQEALRHTEYDANWQLLPRTALLSEVVNAFDAAERNGKRLDALLVTQSGRATESLLGIVTIHDVPKVFRELTK